MKRRINMRSQDLPAFKVNADSDEEQTPAMMPMQTPKNLMNREIPQSHSRNQTRRTLHEAEATQTLTFNPAPSRPPQKLNHLRLPKKSFYKDYLQDLKKRTSKVQSNAKEPSSPKQSRIILRNSIIKNSFQNSFQFNKNRLENSHNIQVRYESSKSDHSLYEHKDMTLDVRKNDKSFANSVYRDIWKKSSENVQNNAYPTPASSSVNMDIKEGSQATYSHINQQPNLPREALKSLNESFSANLLQVRSRERVRSPGVISDSEFRVSSERSQKRESPERLPITSYVSPAVHEKIQELNGTWSSGSQIQQNQHHQGPSQSSSEQNSIRIHEQHARMKQDGMASTRRTQRSLETDAQISFQRKSVVLKKQEGYQVLSPPAKMGVERKKYAYEYGYQANPYSPKAIIEVEPGQNLFGLGAKLQREETVAQRTASQMKQNDEVVSISDNITSAPSIKPSPSPEVKFHEKKAKLFHRSEQGEKIFIAGHKNFDPIEYMQDHFVLCKKFNYSVPQSYDDLPCLVSVSRDANKINIYNIEGVDKMDVKKLTRPINTIDVSQITGFIYGGSGTRFWMLRLGINQRIADNLIQYETPEGSHATRLKEGFELPFYAWQCISIHTQEREIDLVIQDEYQMKAFIQFLILRLDSMNGKPGSVKVLQDNGILRKNVTTLQMLPRIYNSFFLMKVRMKISFEAAVQSKTIVELFLFSILKTYKIRNEQGMIADPWPKIGKKHIDHLREASMKDIAKKGKMEQEAIYRQHARMERPEEEKKGDVSSPEFEEQKDQKDMKMLGVLAGAVLKKDGIDELFGDHLDTDEEDPQQTKLTEFSVKDLKQAEKEFRERKEPTEEEKEKEKIQNQRKRFLFKKRMALQETRTIYTRTLMIIKLRIMKGPLFVYALLQAMQLCKHILALQLESGRECVIPEQLGQKHLPLSFQYYDSILEITRQHVSKDQKRFILKLNFNGDKIKMKQAKQVPVSLQQRISRYVKKNWKRLAKYQNDETFEHNLNLYQKSQSVQTARYLQIDKANLRVKHEIGADEEMIIQRLSQEIHKRMVKRAADNPGSRNVGQNQKDGSFQLKTFSQMTSGLVGVDQLKRSDRSASHLPDHQRVQIDFNYITHQGVGRKRGELFKKKIFYQNQLMSLKEKGRRLLICNKIEQQSLKVLVQILENEHMQAHGHTHEEVKRCDSEQFNNAKSLLGVSGIQRSKQLKSNTTKQQLDDVMMKIATFEAQTREYQESNVVQMRRKLIRDLKKIVPFNEKNELIDRKIEYDQRFFNDGYAEFQLMICDIRKQVRLNEEILKLRKELERVYDDMVTNEEKTYKDEIKKFKGNLKRQIIQTQFTNKMKEMKTLQDEAQENQRVVSKLIEHQKFQIKSNQNSKSQTPAESEAGLQMKKDGEFYDNFIVESDAEDESNSNKQVEKTAQKTQRDIKDRLVVRPKKQPNSAKQKRQERIDSQVSDVDHMQWQGKDDEVSPGRTIDNENAYDQFLKKMKKGSPASKHRSQALQQVEQLREDSAERSRSASLKKMRSQSHAIKNILAEFIKRKMSATDESDQKTISKAETIQRKIMKRRSKIKQVSQQSCKSLWGKGGGYQPYDIGKAKDDPKYKSLVTISQAQRSQRSISQTIANQSENSVANQR